MGYTQRGVRGWVIALSVAALVLSAPAGATAAGRGAGWPSTKVERKIMDTFLSRHFVLPESSELLFALVSRRAPRFAAVFAPKLFGFAQAAAKTGSTALPLSKTFFRQDEQGNWKPVTSEQVPSDARQDLTTGKPGKTKTITLGRIDVHFDWERHEKYVAPRNACNATWTMNAQGDFHPSFPPIAIPEPPSRSVYEIAAQGSGFGSDSLADMTLEEKGSCVSVGARHASCDLKLDQHKPGYVGIEVAGDTVKLVVVPFESVSPSTISLGVCGQNEISGFPEVNPVSPFTWLQEDRPDYWLASLHAEKIEPLAKLKAKGGLSADFTFKVQGRDPLKAQCVEVGMPLEDPKDCTQKHEASGSIQ